MVTLTLSVEDAKVLHDALASYDLLSDVVTRVAARTQVRIAPDYMFLSAADTVVTLAVQSVLAAQISKAEPPVETAFGHWSLEDGCE